MKCFASPVMKRLKERFTRLYGPKEVMKCMNRMEMLIGRYGVSANGIQQKELWNEKDAVLITYGDMVTGPEEKPLHTLKGFLCELLSDAISTVHILPFFPFSSDDGFSIIDYSTVNEELGNWNDIADIGGSFRLMFDLVLNHVSRQSDWFKNYIVGISPHRHYFIVVDPKADLSAVVRPRSAPLLTSVKVHDEVEHLWTTFSEDQIDLNFANPDVLFEFLDILLFYIYKGARIIRLDAIAYLWKEIGTSCIHLPKAHEIVKLMRDVVEMVAPHMLLLTETNVPNDENLSYFGEGDEAHMVYQFPLPPLILHGLLTGQTKYLTRWASSLPELPPGRSFLNFTASHDGIGVRPLEGIVPAEEIDQLADIARKRGGRVSTKTNTDGSESPYELNITYFDALSDTDTKDEALNVARFLCSQAVPLVLKGVPAVYFNSLVAAKNDLKGMKKTGAARSINRKKWDAKKLFTLLNNTSSVNSRVFNEYVRLLRLRADHPAFHPDGAQRIVDLGDTVFAIERNSPDGTETVLAIFNFTAKKVTQSLKGKTSPPGKDAHIKDLISGKDLGPEINEITLKPYQAVWLSASPKNRNNKTKK